MKKMLIILLILSSFKGVSQNGLLLLDESIMKQDKQAHVMAGLLIGAISYGAMYDITNGNKKTSMLVSLGITTLAGIVKELADKKTTGFNEADMWHTISGGIIINLTFKL